MHDQRQTIVGIANHSNLGVGTFGQRFRGLNSFPLQQLRADAWGTISWKS